MIPGLWFALILILLMLSVTGLPIAFLGVIVVFYVPIILGLLYMIWELVGTVWFTTALLCLVLFLI